MLQSQFDKYFNPSKKEDTIRVLKGLESIAKELGYSQAQLCLAWTLANSDVSVAILGFSRLS
jgi:aryl-alcohol dehydrogenase-like predicted oxidoreductase